MPPRKRSRRSNVDNEKTTASQQAKRDFEHQIEELMKLYDDVDPDEINKFQHPFEIGGLCKDKPLSPIQRAITYCMNHRGGSATDEEIVAFIRRFWSTIGSASDHQYRAPPDKRVLHINYSIVKENRPLFIRVDETHWAPNKLSPTSHHSSHHSSKNVSSSSSSSASASASSSGNSNSTKEKDFSKSHFNSNSNSASSAMSSRRNENGYFQERLMWLIKELNMPMTTEEIAQHCESFKDAPGSFDNLSLLPRVKSVLAAKKVLGEVCYNEEKETWTLPKENERRNRSDDLLPRELRGIRMRELTINDLWLLLKEKGIY
ncbi:hypothetical protein TRFO_06324 [Tritrichomonas foetus]|uniref:Uncharacterized protein n=1 Tax=Tritrichomonas foetus TaxID=1144522 RepID=A0A1J4K0X3_9EUKA|nr:hypothetical protein TRFO_06324 [Tritrichomonas foetus]|eukprot:OHT04432.1 hypothetical protein TRFO_06324 [Tritrichomonas foetus]